MHHLYKCSEDFQSEHGEVNAVLSRDDMGDLIEKMMNRDASVDIYVIQASSAEFEAIRDRGGPRGGRGWRSARGGRAGRCGRGLRRCRGLIRSNAKNLTCS